MEDTPEFRLLLLEKQQETINETLGDIRDSQRQIAESLVKLTSLEALHIEQGKALERAFTIMEAHTKLLNDIDRRIPDELSARLRTVEQNIPENLGTRLHSVELAMPGLKETRRWVITGVLGIVGVVGMAILGLAIIKDSGKQAPPVVIPSQPIDSIPRDMRR